MAVQPAEQWVGWKAVKKASCLAEMRDESLDKLRAGWLEHHLAENWAEETADWMAYQMVFLTAATKVGMTAAWKAAETVAHLVELRDIQQVDN